MMKYVFSLFCVLQTAFAGLEELSYSRRRFPRLTNDDLARPGEFPFMVSLRYQQFHRCGGALVSERHVLTVAHCVVDECKRILEPSAFSIIAGSTDLWNLTGTVEFGVQSIDIHPNFNITYNPESLINDIAVVKLSEKIVKSDSVNYDLLLPKDRIDDDSVPLIVVGFGSTSLYGTLEFRLKKLEVFVVNRTTCQGKWWEEEKLQLQPGHLCVHSKQGHGICRGDSGGPLIRINEKNEKLLVGIASGNTDSGCAMGVPDIYTDVLQYLDYIKLKIER